MNSLDGALVLIVRPVGEGRIDGARGSFSGTIWLEDADTVRMSLRSRVSDAVAYVQGGSTLLRFVAELGLETTR